MQTDHLWDVRLVAHSVDVGCLCVKAIQDSGINPFFSDDSVRSLAGIDADAWTLQALLANLDENKQGPKR